MDTLSAIGETASLDISVDEREAAGRYITAIVARDTHASVDPEFATRLTRQLWDRFGAEYIEVATGPYARHGQAALRSALGRL